MKRVASVDDALYTTLRQREERKLAKMAADLGWQCPALPLEGIEDAFKEMADHVLISCDNSGDSCRWCFFYSTPPRPRETELNANWWKSVYKWWQRLEQHAALIKKDGTASQQREWRDLTKYAAMIRGTIANCWNARHPQVTGSWEAEGRIFVVTYVR